MSAKFTIKQILADHWDSFLRIHPNVRPVVLSEVDRVLRCGDLAEGFAMYQCPHCHSYKFVPFRCHSRFCNTCGTAYQANRADSIAEKTINCHHRHIVFTIAAELRAYFLKDRSLLHILFRTSAQVISQWAASQNKKERFSHGMICGLHTFGRDLKWNPHVHMLVTEGADGFYVHAPSSDFNDPSSVANYITRYIGRPAMAQSRITAYDGKFVTFRYQRHEDDQPVFETLPAHKFIGMLIRNIPEKGFHMLRYYGLYARPYSQCPHLIRKISAQFHAARRQTHGWVFRIELSFGFDPLKCSRGNYMEFVDAYSPGSPARPPPYMPYYFA